jgi:exopolysaccharide production protein ExoQ
MFKRAVIGNGTTRPIPSAPSGAGHPAPRAREGKPSLVVTLMIWVLIIFIVVPEGFEYQGVSSMPTEGSIGSRIIWLALLGFGAVTVMRRWRHARALLSRVNPYLLGFAALVAASILWSADPAVTLRRMVRVTTILLDALACALVGWNMRTFQRLVRPALTLLLLGSILFVLLAPQLAVEQSASVELANAWHGLATQKNGFGSIAGTATILWLHAWLARDTKPLTALLGLSISVFCLAHSRSSTSIMAAAFTCLFMTALLRSPASMRRYMPYVVGAFAILLVTYSLAVLKLLPGSELILSPITALTGKDQTFTGRTAIWAIINDHIRLAPLLGTGYGAYWTGAVPSSPSYVMLQKLFFYPSEAHNGYLDVINDLGVPGIVCLCGFVYVYLRQALELFAAVRTQGALFLGLMFQQLIANLSESRWFNVLTVEFVIVTLATVALGRSILQLRAERTVRAASAPAAPRAGAHRAR